MLTDAFTVVQLISYQYKFKAVFFDQFSALSTNHELISNASSTLDVSVKFTWVTAS